MTGTTADWPLTDRDRAEIRADLKMELRALERIDDTEPLPHMVDEYLRRRAACLMEITRLRALLGEVVS